LKPQDLQSLLVNQLLGESEFAAQLNQFIFLKLTQNQTQHLRAIPIKLTQPIFFKKNCLPSRFLKDILSVLGVSVSALSLKKTFWWIEK